MKITICLPTNKPHELEYIRDLKPYPGISFSVAINGHEFSSHDEFNSGSVAAVYHQVKNPKEIPMTLLRHMAETRAIENFNPDYMVIADGDFRHSKDSFDQYIAIARQMSAMGGNVFCHFPWSCMGGSRRGLSPVNNACMGSGRGILYPRTAISGYEGNDDLFGGSEEGLFTLTLLKKMGMIPVKHFYGKTKSSPRRRQQETGSPIHDRQQWDKNCVQRIRELWNDPNWKLSVDISDNNYKDRLLGPYKANQPHAAMLHMRQLNAKIRTIDKFRFLFDPE
jgi:hypothetical protein